MLSKWYYWPMNHFFFVLIKPYFWAGVWKNRRLDFWQAPWLFLSIVCTLAKESHVDVVLIKTFEPLEGMRTLRKHCFLSVHTFSQNWLPRFFVFFLWSSFFVNVKNWYNLIIMAEKIYFGSRDKWVLKAI